MGNLFGSGSKPKAPKPQAPIPTPVDAADEIGQKDRARRRAKIAAAGRGGTILTQGQILASGQGSILGRSNA